MLCVSRIGGTALVSFSSSFFLFLHRLHSKTFELVDFLVGNSLSVFLNILFSINYNLCISFFFFSISSR